MSTGIMRNKRQWRPFAHKVIRAANRRLLMIFDTIVVRGTLQDGTWFTSPVRCVDKDGVVWTDDGVMKRIKR